VGRQDVFRDEKPGLTALMFWKLRRNAPDIVSSTSAMAISETIRIERSHAWRKPPVVVRISCFQALCNVGTQGPQRAGRKNCKECR